MCKICIGNFVTQCKYSAFKGNQENTGDLEQDNFPTADISTATGEEDLGVLGYLPDSQSLQVGSVVFELGYPAHAARPLLRS
jgi:hypothetical protein